MRRTDARRGADGRLRDCQVCGGSVHHVNQGDRYRQCEFISCSGVADVSARSSRKRASRAVSSASEARPIPLARELVKARSPSFKSLWIRHGESQPRKASYNLLVLGEPLLRLLSIICHELSQVAAAPVAQEPTPWREGRVVSYTEPGAIPAGVADERLSIQLSAKLPGSSPVAGVQDLNDSRQFEVCTIDQGVLSFCRRAPPA